MPAKFITNVDLNNNELQNVRVQSLATAPSNPTAGRIYYDTTLLKIRYYNGTAWINLEAPVDITGKTDKVSGATDGDFAGLDTNGNLTDSGKKAADFILMSAKGAASGVATLDASGKVPSSQLPSYVDDVIEILTISDTAPESPSSGDMYYAPAAKLIYTYNTSWGDGTTPESGKIYVALDTNYSYRWSGSALGMVQIGGSSGSTTKYSAKNPLLTASGGVCTWTVTHNLNSQSVLVNLRLNASPYTEVIAEVTMPTANTVAIAIISETDIAADTYVATVIG